MSSISPPSVPLATRSPPSAGTSVAAGATHFLAPGKRGWPVSSRHFSSPIRHPAFVTCHFSFPIPRSEFLLPHFSKGFQRSQQLSVPGGLVPPVPLECRSAIQRRAVVPLGGLVCLDFLMLGQQVIEPADVPLDDRADEGQRRSLIAARRGDVAIGHKLEAAAIAQRHPIDCLTPSAARSDPIGWAGLCRLAMRIPIFFLAQDGLQGGGSDRPLNRYNRTSLSSLPSPRPAPFPKSEPLTHGKHSGSHRRRQMLREGSDHALARWRDVPPLLVGRGHQEWPG